MKNSIQNTIAFLLLALVFSTAAQAQKFEIPFYLIFKNVTSPENNNRLVDPNDEFIVTWQLNKQSDFAKNQATFHKIGTQKISLLVQLELGAPAIIATLYPQNNPRELSVRLKVADYEYLLDEIKGGTYGNKWKPGTKFYLKFDDLQVTAEKGGDAKNMEVPDRQLFFGFALKGKE